MNDVFSRIGVGSLLCSVASGGVKGAHEVRGQTVGPADERSLREKRLHLVLDVVGRCGGLPVIGDIYPC